MISLRKRILAFIIALTVFVSNGGVVLASHYCSAMNNTDVSVFKDDSCCSDEKDACSDRGKGTLVNEKCCSLSISYFHVDIPSVIPVFVSQDEMLLPGELLVFNNEIFFSEKTSSGILSNAPLFFTSGKSFLHFAHILLI